jgi:hypothetical protein
MHRVLDKFNAQLLKVPLEPRLGVVGDGNGKAERGVEGLAIGKQAGGNSGEGAGQNITSLGPDDVVQESVGERLTGSCHSGQKEESLRRLLGLVLVESLDDAIDGRLLALVSLG